MLHRDTAKKFFSNLYAEPVTVDSSHFDEMATRVVARLGGTSVVGDQALQGLMINYILSDPSRASTAKRLSAIVAGIKQRAVDEFAKAFPDANLDGLVKAAKESGYEVEVLK